MKKKYRFSLLFVTFLLVSSCKEEVETQVSTTPKEIIMPRVQPLSVATTPSIAPVPTQTIQNTTPPVMPQLVKVAKGMNPSHGQPGHRCDIAVGAPLNSPVKSNLATNTTKSAPYTITQTPTPPATITPAAAASTTPALLNPNASITPPGMNPPHGQAGHRCDVKVGEALPKS